MNKLQEYIKNRGKENVAKDCDANAIQKTLEFPPAEGGMSRSRPWLF